MSKRGLLVIFSGPSGSGKGTVLQSLLTERPDVAVSISATTRQPRPGEQDGVHYFFRQREEFEQMIVRISCSNMPNIAATTMARRCPLLSSSGSKVAMWCWKSRCKVRCR